MISVRRLARIGLLAVGLLSLGACASAQVQVARGTLDTGTWSAWIYEGGGDLGVCLEIRATDRRADRLCGLQPDNAGSWRPDGPAGSAKFLVITTAEQPAVVARTALADGHDLRTTAGSAPSLTELHFFVVTLAAGAAPTQVDILDGAGVVLTTLPLQ